MPDHTVRIVLDDVEIEVLAEALDIYLRARPAAQTIASITVTAPRKAFSGRCPSRGPTMLLHAAVT